jgi:hypothetical protein
MKHIFIINTNKNANSKQNPFGFIELKGLLIKKAIIFLLVVSISCLAYPQRVIESHFLTRIPKETLNYFPLMPAEYDVDAYYIKYHTIDAHGDSTYASGACFVPVTDTCNYFPIISYQHGTTLKKTDVPSRLNGESTVGQVYSSLGNIVLCPDYLGLGDSPGFHPYCHGESQATATVDFIRAAREMLVDSLGIFHNGQIFLTGYSQGGHATMATHKYIEDNNLSTEFQIVASAPASGPYNISGAQAEMMLNDPGYPSPAYFVYILYSYNEVYNNIFDSPSEVFKQPYDQSIPPFMNGNYSTSQLNNHLPDSLHHFLQDSFLLDIMYHMDDKLSPFWQNLVDNDNHNWLPTAPVRMYYCSADEQVSYLNSVIADSIMNALGASDVTSINADPNGNHGSCGLPTMAGTYLWFASLRTPCVSTANLQKQPFHDITVYPNPTNSHITISGFSHHSLIQIYNLNLVLVYENQIFEKETHISVDWLPSGIYTLKIRTMDNQTIVKKISIIK